MKKPAQTAGRVIHPARQTCGNCQVGKLTGGTQPDCKVDLSSRAGTAETCSPRGSPRSARGRRGAPLPGAPPPAPETRLTPSPARSRFPRPAEAGSKRPANETRDSPASPWDPTARRSLPGRTPSPTRSPNLAAQHSPLRRPRPSAAARTAPPAGDQLLLTPRGFAAAAVGGASPGANPWLCKGDPGSPAGLTGNRLGPGRNLQLCISPVAGRRCSDPGSHTWRPTAL
ncbi:atherin-like [Mus musculus]|jgi:hypothetical protein|uniref:atherin-like n=1 Tax=Mus musculus TaxID=10090 RepID=UPI0007EE1A98|nr:atherin-like [Mus musculus]|eukprot:XP_017176681.1 PREDICTED: atherin-like [Mus musculus]